MRGDGKGSAGCGEQQRGTPSTKGKLLKWRNQTSEKTGAGPVITVFLLFLLLFHAAWYSYIGGGYPHNQQNQHLGEAWKFAITHETGKSQCIDN
jgi:hypothetical protein